jgi:WD40 repeat protein
VLQEALELDPAARSRYIDDIYASDDNLHEEVASLFEAHEQADRFLSAPKAEFEALDEFTAPEPWTGQHIGPYHLVRERGSGGMGEVYLAVRGFLQAAYSPDGSHIVTSSDDHTARIWVSLPRVHGRAYAVVLGQTTASASKAADPDSRISPQERSVTEME